MDLVNCSLKRSSKNCCETRTDSELGSCDHIYTTLVECKNNDINIEDHVNIEPVMTVSTSKRNGDFRKKATWSLNSKILTHQSSAISIHKTNEIDETIKEMTRPSYRLRTNEADFRCPRCSRRMEEPRLLPCLHPICLFCVYELMSKPPYVPVESLTRDSFREMCPLCDSHLPNVSSIVPPPHYPLQHRLVMDTIRRRLVNRVLCDSCIAEVPALIQCSTCLRNFCLQCGRRHEQQNIAEAKITNHLMRPLWEATKIRRTILCQVHSTHTLRFYCIACQQVACKECMWSIQHRGHASEDAIGAGKRAGMYLTMMLQRAKAVLNALLTQYNYDVFSSNGFEEPQNITKLCRYV